MDIRNYKILSGSALKMIAVITMLIDHLAAFLLFKFQFFMQPIITLGTKEITLYYIFRTIGRLAFPIFCFLLVEGFIHTHDRKKYGINLLVFAIISEIPWNFVHTNSLRCERQNVFFTLLLGYLGLCIIEKYKDSQLKQATYLLGLFFVAYLLKADYGYLGYGFILLTYALRENKVIQAVVGSCILPSTWKAGIAFIPINMYNGQRGFIKAKWMKYAFYAFYPVHLFVLFLIRRYVI